MEGECFLDNLSEDNKVSESKMAVSESNMTEFKMAAINKFSQNEWVKLFLCKLWELILASVSDFERKNWEGWIQDGQIKMAAIIKLSENEWVWVRLN